MPVVLVEVGGVARSGHEYDDRTGITYEFPAGRYERWIRPGELFVYQVPRRGYTGCGVVGEIRPSSVPGRLSCEVLSVRMFDSPVPLKDNAGNYYEADPAFWAKRVYWGQGVRPLSDERFNAILAAAPQTAARQLIKLDDGYATSTTAQAVEEYSVRVAVAAMARRYEQDVTVMPRSNPGFDLLVGPRTIPIRYVEVKGTQNTAPVFFLSEGERQFSVGNSDRYTLFLVFGIDLNRMTHFGESTYDGAVDSETFQLRPIQWRGRGSPEEAKVCQSCRKGTP